MSAFLSLRIMGRSGAHHLQLVLPKLLLLRLIQKREFSNMMHENISQDRQIRIQWGDFTKLRSKRRAESLEGGWGVELSDLEFDLLGNEFALEIC